eukprot:TRINITY_DN303460_c0_g1_i2.p1 TRINITY_DN303460_c0_g1~~TRINITY_DN303460_c0_g1_i2.p1  ORF type:complete len:520 (-),score=144.49 TRINITY_DN303460_c0_g1_i2:440-1999(-)
MNATERTEIERYLDQNSLELILNQVLNECVTERPVDPFSYLSRELKSRSTAVKGIDEIYVYERFAQSNESVLQIDMATTAGRVSTTLPFATITDEITAVERCNIVKSQIIDKFIPVLTGEEPIQPAIDTKISDFMLSIEEPQEDNEKPTESTEEGETTEEKPSEEKETTEETEITIKAEKIDRHASMVLSLSAMKAGAMFQELPLYRHFAYVHQYTDFCLPVPFVNVIAGGTSSNNGIVAESISIGGVMSETLESSVFETTKVISELERILKEKTNVDVIPRNMNGVMVPALESTEAALDIIISAMEAADCANIKIAIDMKAGAFRTEKDAYDMLGFKDPKKKTKPLNEEMMMNHYRDLLSRYPQIVSLQDPFAYEDEEPLSKFCEEFDIQVLLNTEGLDIEIVKGKMQRKCFTGVIMNLLEAETLTSFMESVKILRKVGSVVVVGHAERKNGIVIDCQDTSIVDLIVGMSTNQVYINSMDKQLVQINRLLHIYEDLMEEFGESGVPFAGEQFRAAASS